MIKIPIMGDRIYNKCSISNLISHDHTSHRENYTLNQHSENDRNKNSTTEPAPVFTDVYLRNFSRNETDDIKELENISYNLHISIKDLCLSVSPEFSVIISSLKTYSITLNRVKSKSRLTDDEIRLLIKIHQFSILLAAMIREKKAILESMKSLENLDPRSMEPDNNSSNIVFNILTPNMVSENGYQSAQRGHRLPKFQVNILESWYKDNVKNPYLTKPTLEMLTEQTGLTINQVRNWISNKRRKEKVSTISEDLAELLS